MILRADGYQGSAGYAGRAHVDCRSAVTLTAPEGEVRQTHFTEQQISRLFGYARLELYVAGLTPDRADDVAQVVEGLAAGSLQRGAGGGTLTIWSRADAVVCEVADDPRGRGSAGGSSSAADGGGPRRAVAGQPAVRPRPAPLDPGWATVRLHAWI